MPLAEKTGMHLIRRPCPICGLASDTVYCEANIDNDKLDAYAFASRKYPERMRHRLMHCIHCDLVYADPAPAKEYLHREYEVASFDSSEEAACAARSYRSYLPAGLRIGKALDIGTGGGEFIGELLAYGFTDVEGIEPSPAAIASAPPRIRAHIRQGIFSPRHDAAGTYSFISCFQTLEHVDDPLALSRDVCALLEKGGVYFTVSHNIRGILNRILGEKSPIFDVEHLQLFSPQSLNVLMRAAGFDEVKIFPLWNRYPLHYWVKLLPLPKPVVARLVAMLKALKIGYLRIPLNVGNVGVIAYKKS